MDAPHYLALLAGYGAAIAGLATLIAVGRTPWPVERWPEMKRPWNEVGFYLLAVVGVVLVGQAYQAGVRLEAVGWLGVAAETVNQAAIFSPLLALLLLRRQSVRTLLLPPGRALTRFGIGAALALIATAAFTAARYDPLTVEAMLAHQVEPAQLRHAAQVLFEDLAIAGLLVRLSEGLPKRWLAPLLVAALFAAGHIPADLADGATAREMTMLAIDFAIGAGLFFALLWTRDVLWFWPVHYAMDATQFFDAPA